MTRKRYRELRDVATRLALVAAAGAPLRKHLAKAHRKDIADLQRVRAWWSSNIAGFGFGPKEVGGARNRRLAIRFYVYQKVHASRLRAQERIPSKIALDHLEEELLTDVEAVASQPVLHAGLPAGSEIGHFSGSLGTTSCYVHQRGSTMPLLLSCAHVLAPFGATLDDPIESPVDSNSSAADNPVGLLHLGSLRPNTANVTDAALAMLSDSSLASNDALDIGPITSMLLAPESLAGMSVEMHGAATGVRVTGRVSSDSLVTMRFRLRGQDYQIQNLLRYDIPVREGDSGAAVIAAGTGQMLGIHVGAEQGTQRAFFAPSWIIAQELGITLA